MAEAACNAPVDPHGEPRIMSEGARDLARLDERGELRQRQPPTDLVIGG